MSAVRRSSSSRSSTITARARCAPDPVRRVGHDPGRRDHHRHRALRLRQDTLLTLIGALRAAQAGSVAHPRRGAVRPRTRRRSKRCAGASLHLPAAQPARGAHRDRERRTRVARHGTPLAQRTAPPAVKCSRPSASKRTWTSGAPDVGRPAPARRDRSRAGRQSGNRAGRRTDRLARQGLGREVVDRMQVLAKEQGATILIVTHDNRILDVADRILHLEDGASRPSPRP